MTISDLLPALAGALVVAAAAGFALLPLLVGGGEPRSARAADATLELRQAVYRQILELDFDYATGKLTAEDYELLTRELLGRAQGLLRAAQADSGAIEQAVEEEIAAARRGLAALRPTAAAAERG